MDAARREFAERGSDGATIAEITKAATVSPGPVLKAGSIKIGLLNAVMREDFGHAWAQTARGSPRARKKASRRRLRRFSSSIWRAMWASSI
ncbi:MAG: TetR family transcriptional regulator [Oceanicaulis sp.]